ncbi:RabGAP/TBC [Hymenopellis radicata]|nr:RabGAP/TBC [Hymenopellis radicata]
MRKSLVSNRDTLSPNPASYPPERVTTPTHASRTSTPAGSPSSLPLKHPIDTSLAASKTSLVPSEGEDLDAFHVRNTYAQLEMSGVKGDGYHEGVERTRARIGASRASQLNAENALGDGTEKTRDLNPDEIKALATVDRYGFFSVPSHDRLVLLPSAPLLKRLARVPAGPATASTSATTLNSLPPTPLPIRETSRIAKWDRMLEAEQRDEGANIQIWRVKPHKRQKLSGRTYKGVPDRWRSAVWELLLREFSRTGNADTIRLGQDYREAMEKPSTYDIQIDLDVPRTISGHIMFRTRYGAGQRSLFHVLHCFSLRCSTCGYVQGMGPIAATLLCYFDPERVYASLVRLHDSYALHSIFSPGFPGLLEAIYVQERITQEMMPDVYAAFKKHMISTTSYATKWYITLFANSVPFQTQLRLWDAFLLEGQDLFVAVAVSIVWTYRDHITANNANFETVLSLLSSFFVPEDENALLFWIEKTLGDRKLRASMASWREDWKRLVAEGKDGSALL